MGFLKIVWRETRHRGGAGLLWVLAAALTVVVPLGAMAVVWLHDAQTHRILAEKEATTKTQLAELQDQMRRATLELKFNVAIFPKDENLQEWQMEDTSTNYMPEEYVDRLVHSKIVSVQHLLPTLQVKVEWPERKRTILLVGTRGEAPDLHKDPKKPMVQPVEAGTVVLGHELGKSLDLKEGDSVVLMGRTFRLAKVFDERGSKDDITAWIDLGEAQQLLDKAGKINAILALECLCIGEEGLNAVRKDIAGILPETQVVELGAGKILARAEARAQAGEEANAALAAEKANRAVQQGRIERLAAVVVALTVLAGGLWMALLGLANVHERRGEVALLRVLGLGTFRVLGMFILKALVLGLAGAGAGLVVLAAATRLLLPMAAQRWGVEPHLSEIARLLGWRLPMALLLPAVVSVLAAWVPALLATLEDPAVVLAKESR